VQWKGEISEGLTTAKEWTMMDGCGGRLEPCAPPVVAGEPRRRRTAGLRRREQTLTRVRRRRRVRFSAVEMARRPAASTEGPVEEARGARDAGRSPEATRKAAASGAGRRRTD
jgi:hypothetical protein